MTQQAFRKHFFVHLSIIVSCACDRSELDFKGCEFESQYQQEMFVGEVNEAMSQIPNNLLRKPVREWIFSEMAWVYSLKGLYAPESHVFNLNKQNLW